MKISKIEEVIIPTDAQVTCTVMNHLIEIQHMEKQNRECHIQKLDKDRYVDKSDGEIKEFNHIENRGDSYNSLRQTFKKLRYLINNNFTGKANELFVTFTFEKDSYDTKELYKDFDKFIKRLKYKFKDSTTVDYINVIEPHASGQWHSHMLIRFNDLESVFIPSNQLAELWGLGFIRIKSLKDVDNIGAYLSAYLTDIELTDKMAIGTALKVQGMEVKVVDGKKFIKGGRLHMYPPGLNIYRKSKGIKYPERQVMSYKKAKKIVGASTPHYSRAYHLESEDYENTISYEQYNTKRHDL